MAYKKVLVLLLGILVVILVTSCVTNEKDVVGQSFSTLTNYQKQKYWQCIQNDCKELLSNKQYKEYRQCSLNCMNLAENTLEQQAWCTDSDGMDFFLKGIVSTDVYPQGKEDYCKTFSNGKTYLIEGKCLNNKYSYMQKSCSEAKKGYLCVEGVCIPECITPPENLDEPWQIPEDTKLCEGNYNIPYGIEITEDGVELDCDGAVIIDNEIDNENNEEFIYNIGINLNSKKDVTVKNCEVRFFQVGIKSKGSDMEYMESNNQIINNIVANNYLGVYFYWSDKNQLKNNQIIDNENSGFMMETSDDNMILENFISNNANTGIYIADASSENKIYDNTISYNYIGINQDNGGENYVVGNTIANNLLYGVEFGEESVMNHVFENNNLFNNKEYNIFNHYEGDITVENNYWGTIKIYEMISKISSGDGFVDFCPYLNAPYPEGEPVECGELYKYKQKIKFENQNTGILGFYQDDDYASVADVYFFVSNKLDTYLYDYSIKFEKPVPYDATSLETASESLVGKTLTTVQGKNGEITFVDLDESHKINRIDIKIDGNTIVFENGYAMEMDEDEFPNINAVAYIKGTIGTLEGFGYKVKAGISPIYLAEGDEFVDPVIGGFKLVFAELVEDDKEKIEVKTSGKKGIIILFNKDSKEISIPIYSSADAKNIVYLGTTTTSTEVDDMIYLENTSCKATLSVTECKGAEFIVSAGSNCEAHLIKVSDINTVDTKISFEDLTYGTETNDYDYNADVAFPLGLSGISDTISLTVGTDYINFTNLGACYYPAANPKYLKMKTKNEGFIYLNYSLGGAAGGQGTSFTQPRITNISFAEYHDTGHAIANTVFISETNNQLLQIDPIYDTSSDNLLKLVFDKSGNVFDTSDLKYTFGLKQSGTNDEVIQTMSYKGTLFTINDVQKNYIEILHPKLTSYVRMFATPYEGYNDDSSSPIKIITDGYEIGNKDFYLGMSLYKIADKLTSSEFYSVLSDGVLTK